MTGLKNEPENRQNEPETKRAMLLKIHDCLKNEPETNPKRTGGYIIQDRV